jgi:hypothetical protein
MILVPIQYFGAGDCVFTQTLVRNLMEPGDKVLWPIESHFCEGFNRAYPDILYVPYKSMGIDYNCQNDYEQEGFRFLPFRWCDTIMKVPYSQCMRAKYDWYGMDFRTWRDKAMWTRDAVREELLFNELGCNKGDYNLVNIFFGSHSQLKVDIKLNNGLPNIHMKTIPGYSLFDWAKVIENASEIHVVNSSILYLLELLTLKCKNPTLYVRKPIEKDFTTTDYLFTKDYKLIY